MGAGLCWAWSSLACPWAPTLILPGPPGPLPAVPRGASATALAVSRVLLDHGGPFTLFFPQECPIPCPVPSEIPFHILETNKVQTSGKFS